jgi:hypothetical protein
MRDLLNALVLILLTVFYCFGSNFNSNTAEFYKITQPSKPYDGLHFTQSGNDHDFSFITKNKNVNPAMPKLKVFAGKKYSNYIYKTILTGNTFSGLTKGKYFITDQYSFQLPSHVLLMIIPFHWFT